MNEKTKFLCYKLIDNPSNYFVKQVMIKSPSINESKPMLEVKKKYNKNIY